MSRTIFRHISIRVILPIVSVAMLATLYVLAQENTGKKYALLVGVKQYEEGTGLRSLDYTEKDVADLGEVLEKQGYKVTVLSRFESKKEDKDFLRPTARNIKQHLKRLVDDSKPGDTLLVALTGHGAHLKSTDKLYFCPSDTDLKDDSTLLAIDDVMAMFNEKSCLAANKVLLVDACRNDPSDGASGGAPKELQSITRPSVPEPPGGTVALFSCSKGQISHESPKQKRGFLFHHVIEGLSGKAANQQGEVTWFRLVNYVTEELPEAVKREKGPLVRQTPEVRGNSRAMILARSDPRNAPMDEPVVRLDPKEITNSIGIKLMRIPKGKFLMGSPESEKKRLNNETQHEVTISQNFYMGATEVTQSQWQKVMGNNPSNFKGDELPVEDISWDDAVEFCKRLSEMPEEKKAGRKYRLPTESEWEYACRAGTTTPFHFGSQLNGRQANCDGTLPYGTDTKGPDLEKTSPIGTYPANAWGLYDMHGNVWEWCSDWYGEYPTGSVTDPIGPATGSYRVARGGCWLINAVFCRSAIRRRLVPSFRGRILGFRVALSSSKDDATVAQNPDSMDQATVTQDPKEITNSIGIKLMRLAKGKFLMGSPQTEEGHGENIETQHEVTISRNFYMGSTEVTQAQWQKVMSNNPSGFKGDELPVEKISWEEAVEFCKRLSEMPEEKKAGRKYRLPTEAEWEYACRAGTTTPFHFGRQLNGSLANCNGTKPYGTETKGPFIEKTSPVGTFPANAWGLYDMHGNVYEWCSDWYGNYPAESVAEPNGPSTGSVRIVRGGGCGNDAVGCRSAARSGFGPSSRLGSIGFRLALSSSLEEATVRQDPGSRDKATVRQDPKEITNSIGIKLMRIPKGKFLMGSPETEEGRSKDETQHEVTINQNFYMGATEVTQAQWQKVMGNNPSRFNGDDLPVETVSWDQAVEFCKRLSEMPEEKKAGCKYRLPTEGEWEYACRAGTTTPFHFGSQLNGTQANCKGTRPYGTSSEGPWLEKTSPVGKYSANAWGLYDMHGNVWEWCSGRVDRKFRLANGSDRALRGGSWNLDPADCRSAYGLIFPPSLRENFLGFRVAMSSPGIPK